MPPQQQDWWVESIFSQSDESKTAAMSKLPVELGRVLREKGVAIGSSENEDGTLPPELMKMVREHFNSDGALPMSEVEAKKHREKLMEVRSAFHFDADDQWHKHSYSFCEH